MSLNIKRILSIILSSSIALTSTYGYCYPTLFGSQPHAKRYLVEDSLTQKRTDIVSDPGSITIPESIGRVIDTYKGEGDFLVVHIQDRHIDPVAQLNIAKIIDEFNIKHNTHLMCLEGASKELNTLFYNKFPDGKIKNKTAKLFVEKGLFTGAEFYKITNTDKSLKAQGTEDKAAYLEHLASYKENRLDRDKILKFLKAVEISINILKKKVYSKQLKDIDKKAGFYYAKQLQLPEYLEALQYYSKKTKVDIEKYKSLNEFIRLIEKEKSVDFKDAQAQREELIKHLSENLENEKLQELLKNSLDFKLNKLSDIAFYNYLEQFLTPNTYNHLTIYIDYLKFSKEINHIKVFDEAEDLEGELMLALSKTPIQKNLVLYSKSVKILQGLYSLELTPRQLHYLDKNLQSSNIVNIQQFLKAAFAEYGLNLNHVVTSTCIEQQAIDNSKRYYQLALKRDIALVGNTLKAMSRSRKERAMLITGGFHTQGITNILKEKDISYVVICPNIGIENYEKLYSDRMAGILPDIAELTESFKHMLSAPLVNGDLCPREIREYTKEAFKEIWNMAEKGKASSAGKERAKEGDSLESTWLPFKPQDAKIVKKSQQAFEYSDSKQNFFGVSLEHFVWAQNKLAEQNLPSEVLQRILSVLGVKQGLFRDAAYQRIYESLTEKGYTREIINLINNSTYQDPRLRIEIIGQNKNPRAQGILEAISNGLDALGLEIGQFGKGVKQIIDWLEPTGADRIDVFTKEKQGLPYQLIILKDTQGQNYIQIRKISLQVFQKACGQTVEQGTVVKIATKNKLPLTGEELGRQRRNSQEGIAEAIHKRFPYVTAVEITTQVENKEPQKVNGFGEKEVIVPPKDSVYTPEKRAGNIQIQLRGHTVKIIDNGRGMAAGVLSRMFVPKQGTKHPEPLSGEAAQKELSKIKVVQDTTLPHRVSFSRNSEVIVAVDIPQDIAKEATTEGGLMIEFGSLLDVPESRDNIIIPLELKSGEKSNFQLAVEKAIIEIISHSTLSNVDKIRYINTIVVGLEELIQGNENYAHTIKAICANTQKLLAEIISALREENFVILPHDKLFKKLTIPQGKEVLFVNKNLFDWQGVLSLKEIGGVVVSGISLDGDKHLPLVLVPFTEESLKGVLRYHRQWHTWQQEGRLPIIRTDRFIAIASNLSGSKRLSELTAKRVKGLTGDEERELALLLQIVNIITAEQVVTSYEITKPKENLRLASQADLIKSQGEIDSEAINKFLARPPVSVEAPIAKTNKPPLDANQKTVLLENGDLLDLETNIASRHRAIEQIELLGKGYYKVTTKSSCNIQKLGKDIFFPPVFHVSKDEGDIIIPSGKRFAYVQRRDGTMNGEVFDVENGQKYYLGSGFSMQPTVKPLQNPYSDLQFSKDGKYLTYLEDKETGQKELVIIKIIPVEAVASAKTKLKISKGAFIAEFFPDKGGEIIGRINLGKGNVEYAINPFANVAFVRDKDSALMSLIDLETGKCVGAGDELKYLLKYLHTDSTGTYTVAVGTTSGDTFIYIHKIKNLLYLPDFGGEEIQSIGTGWKNGKAVYWVIFENNRTLFFTEEGDIYDKSFGPFDYREGFINGTYKAARDGEWFHRVISVDPLQRLNQKGAYKHPHFDLFIDNSDPDNPVAIGMEPGKKIPFKGEVVNYKPTRSKLISYFEGKIYEYNLDGDQTGCFNGAVTACFPHQSVILENTWWLEGSIASDKLKVAYEYSSVSFDGKYFVFLNPKTGDVIYLDPARPEEPIFVSAQGPIDTRQEEIFNGLLLAANEISDPFYKAEALAAIAQALAQSGDITQSQELVTQALTIAENDISDSYYYKAKTLAAIAQAAAQSGNITQAQKLFAQALTIARNDILDFSYKTEVLTAIAQALAQSGDITQALTIVRNEITSSFYKAETLAAIAQAAAQSGNITQAQKLFTQALTIARNDILDLPYKTKTLAAIAQALAQSGNITQAQELVTQALTIAENDISNSYYHKTKALAAIAQAAAQSGNITQAQELVTQALTITENDIFDFYHKTKALAAIAQAAAQSGNITQAQELVTQALTIVVNNIPSSDHKAETLAAIAQAVAQSYHDEWRGISGMPETKQDFEIETKDEKKAIKLWQNNILPRRDEFIAQAKIAYEPFLELIPEEYEGDIERIIKQFITKLYEDQEKEIVKRYKDALSGETLDLGIPLPFDMLSERMHEILKVLPEYLNSVAGLLTQEEYTVQKDFYNILFSQLFWLSSNPELRFDVIDSNVFEVLGHGWDIDAQEKVDAIPLIARFIQDLKGATYNQIKLSEITDIVQFLSCAASLDDGKNIQVVKNQLSKILDAKDGVKRKFLERLHQTFKVLDFDDILSYIEHPDKPHNLGEARAFIIFLANEVEQIKEKRRLVFIGRDFALAKGGIELSQIIKLEQRRPKAGEEDIVMDIDYLLEHIHSPPKRSNSLEAELLKNITVQAESGGYAREITQNSSDAESSELVIDFYLQKNEYGEEEYVEEAADDGTGALKEVALLIPKSTKAKGEQIELAGFFGTGKYTIFEGVDRLEFITKNRDRAYIFSFTVIKDTSGKPKAIKLTGIRKVNDESVKQGVTVRRIKTIDNTIPELDAMLAQRSWKTFAGLAQNENFTIYLLDYEGNKQPLLIEKELLAQSDFIATKPTENKSTNFGNFKIISARDMPLQIVDKAGLRVCSLKEEYLELIPASLRRHIEELGIIIQIPLPLIRNRTAFEYEDEYLPVIQKYVAIEFYKAIAYKALTQTDPQFVFAGFPLDWETSDSYWDSIDLNDRYLVELADRINKNEYAEIENRQLRNLLSKPGILDKEKSALKLLMLLEVAKETAQPGQRVSLLLRRLAVQQKINAVRARAQSETLKSAGLTMGIVPSFKEIPYYHEKVVQAQGIETARRQIRNPERYIIPQDKYTSLEWNLVALAHSMARYIGIVQILLVGDVQFAGAFKRYQGKSTMFLNCSLASRIVQKESGVIDEAADTLIHELAHLLEEFMFQDDMTGLLEQGYVAHLANFTHDAVGTFAEAMKYVAAISLANHNLSDEQLLVSSQIPATQKETPQSPIKSSSAGLFVDESFWLNILSQNGLQEVSIEHTQRNIRAIEYFAEKEKLNARDKEILKVALWLHDISKDKLSADYIPEDKGLASTFRLLAHHLESAKLAEEILEQLGYDEKFRKQVKDIIVKHMGPIEGSMQFGNKKVGFMELTRLAKLDAIEKALKVSGININRKRVLVRYIDSLKGGFPQPESKLERIARDIDLLDLAATGVTKVVYLRQTDSSFFKDGRPETIRESFDSALQSARDVGENLYTDTAKEIIDNLVSRLENFKEEKEFVATEKEFKKLYNAYIEENPLPYDGVLSGETLPETLKTSSLRQDKVVWSYLYSLAQIENLLRGPDIVCNEYRLSASIDALPEKDVERLEGQYKGRLPDILSHEKRYRVWMDLDDFAGALEQFEEEEYWSRQGANDHVRPLDELIKILKGSGNKVLAHGVGRWGGIEALLNIMLEGRINSSPDGRSYFAELNFSLKGYGPYYVVLDSAKMKKDNLIPDDDVISCEGDLPADYHNYYIVPSVVNAKEFLIKGLKEAARKNLFANGRAISKEYVEVVISKLKTYEEFIAEDYRELSSIKTSSAGQERAVVERGKEGGQNTVPKGVTKYRSIEEYDLWLKLAEVPFSLHKYLKKETEFRRTILVDAGCGEGIGLKGSKLRYGENLKAYGIDLIDWDLIGRQGRGLAGLIKKYGEEKALERLFTFIRGDMGKVILPENADLIISFFALQYHEDPLRAWEHLFNQLSPSGRIATHLLIPYSNKREIFGFYDSLVKEMKKVGVEIELYSYPEESLQRLNIFLIAKKKGDEKIQLNVKRRSVEEAVVRLGDVEGQELKIKAVSYELIDGQSPVIIRIEKDTTTVKASSAGKTIERAEDLRRSYTELFEDMAKNPYECYFGKSPNISPDRYGLIIYDSTLRGEEEQLIRALALLRDLRNRPKFEIIVVPSKDGRNLIADWGISGENVKTAGSFLKNIYKNTGIALQKAFSNEEAPVIEVANILKTQMPVGIIAGARVDIEDMVAKINTDRKQGRDRYVFITSQHPADIELNGEMQRSFLVFEAIFADIINKLRNYEKIVEELETVPLAERLKMLFEILPAITNPGFIQRIEALKISLEAAEQAA